MNLEYAFKFEISKRCYRSSPIFHASTVQNKHISITIAWFITTLLWTGGWICGNTQCHAQREMHIKNFSSSNSNITVCICMAICYRFDYFCVIYLYFTYFNYPCYNQFHNFWIILKQGLSYILIILVIISSIISELSWNKGLATGRNTKLRATDEYHSIDPLGR